VRVAGGGLLALPFLAAALASGCSAYTGSIRTDARPDPRSAYVYGRFAMYATGGNNELGFVVRCSGDTKDDSYIIGFSRRQPLRVFEIMPGSCTIDEIVYTEGQVSEKARRAAPLSMLRGRELAPGVAYYIGDFAARSTAERMPTALLERRKWLLTWGITDTRDDYARTTEEMKRTYPKLASLPTENAMGRARKDSSGGDPATP
jgi:hypothetical protein